MKRTTLQAVVAATIAISAAYGAAPGITGPTFNLTAQTANLNQPDGAAVYAWGYGCNGAPAGFAPTMANQNCPSMQVPGPTLIVTEGQTVSVTLTNGLPTSAGNTSILFPGFTVKTSGGVAGLLTQEAAPGGTVTYTFTASSPGTRAYYSGTQSDLQIEMGLYGAVIVLPKTPGGSAGCAAIFTTNANAQKHWNESNFRLSTAAYDIPQSCYDREYLFQFAEMDPVIHKAALAQVTATQGCTAGAQGCSLNVPTEPYHPTYFLINGRSMPDDMDPNYGAEYPHQPYNGNPHLHPGEQVLLRIIGQGRWQHPFHEHANHVRILARDGNLVLTPDGQALAGPPLFTTTTTPGMAMDGIFYFTGRGLNWDMYGHTANSFTKDPQALLSCTADANGYNTGGNAYQQINYFEWCQDHNKPLESAPFGDVASGGPVTLPNPNIFTNGAWYGGSPYLGPDATLRATSSLRPSSSGTGDSAAGCVTNGSSTPNCTNLQPSNTQANPSNERGFAFMWHSH
ncbi:MAG: multicopper oxidase family protein, partial [Acidobacteriaceae bacterium]|nr:multicopper oxidase family protein [Acidobacteriaceae bacterium]